ncbi:FkbM family methyltransferase [Delftia sp. WSY_4]|uniref:FkbM family methyltransferase n=1 Tax=unclassified Delftia TaxID=2613839 RepID=UPI003709EB99
MTQTVFERDLWQGLAPLADEEAARLDKLIARYGQQRLGEFSRQVYEPFTEPHKQRFVIWFAKRWAGIERLPAQEYEAYLQEVKRVREHPYQQQALNGRSYKRLELAPQGFRGELLTYPWMLGIHDFLFGQYRNEDFGVRPGDTIIDAGAFVGDTAVLFHQEAQGDCQIHAFELLDENLALLRHNLAVNDIADDVHVCHLALTARSGDVVNIKAPPVQGATSIFGDAGGKPVETITIDDYVRSAGLQRVDFIKMDIEGAERQALQGALQTLQTHRPRLALCIYHLWDDSYEIPRIIASSGVAYRYDFKWAELTNGWEAVLLCMPCEPR